MLASTRVRTSAASRSVVARAMASSAPPTPLFTLVVKGKPETKQLLDCPFCHRVLLTLARKKIPFDMEYIDLTKPRPEWLMQANAGKVPVIKEKDTMLPDSDKIVVMLEERFPQPSMKSSAPEGIAAKVFPAFRAYLQSSPEEEEAKKQALLAELTPINDYLAQEGKGPLFGGLDLDATDAAFAPRLYHIMVALKHYKGFQLPASYAALWRYMAWVQLLPEWQAVDYGSDSIIAGWGVKH